MSLFIYLFIYFWLVTEKVEPSLEKEKKKQA